MAEAPMPRTSATVVYRIPTGPIVPQVHNANAVAADRIRDRRDLRLSHAFADARCHIEITIRRTQPTRLQPHIAAEPIQPLTHTHQTGLFQHQIDRSWQPAPHHQIDRTLTADLIRDTATIVGLHIPRDRHRTHLTDSDPRRNETHTMPALASDCERSARAQIADLARLDVRWLRISWAKRTCGPTPWGYLSRCWGWTSERYGMRRTGRRTPWQLEVGLCSIRRSF
jgi:hypothetical protein